MWVELNMRHVSLRGRRVYKILRGTAEAFEEVAIVRIHCRAAPIPIRQDLMTLPSSLNFHGCVL